MPRLSRKTTIALIGLFVCLIIVGFAHSNGRWWGKVANHQDAADNVLQGSITALPQYWTDPDLQMGLQQILDQVPSAALARLAVILSVPSASDTLPLLRWSVVAARAQPWFPNGPGPPVLAAPVSNWAGYLFDMSEGQCADRIVADLNPTLTQHLTKMGIVEFVACPVMVNKALIGVVFIGWGSQKRTADAKLYYESIKDGADKLGKILTAKAVKKDAL